MFNKSLYIISSEPKSGSLIVTMGFMEILKSSIKNIAFFKPVIAKEEDNDINFIINHYNLNLKYEDTYGFTLEEVETLISENKEAYFIESLIQKFKKLENEYDFVICTGLSLIHSNTFFDFDMNIKIANNLSSPIVSIINGYDKTLEKIKEEIIIQENLINSRKSTQIALFVNRLSKKNFQSISKTKINLNTPLFFLPNIKELDSPTIRDIKNYINAQVIFGEDDDLRRVVKDFKVAAMSIENILSYLEEGDLVIAPSDRVSIILACMMANFSTNFPNISGILLTGGFYLNENIMNLLKGIESFKNIPILFTKDNTYKTALKANKTPAKITTKSVRKIALAMGMFHENVNQEIIEQKLKTIKSQTITPNMFEYDMFEKARKNKKTIVLPESEDDRILKATEILLRRNVVTPILLGKKEVVLNRATSLGLDISKAIIIDNTDEKKLEKYAQIFHELRKAKGLTYNAAYDSMHYKSYFATMMVYTGEADGMVSGAITTTAETIRPALQIIKTNKNISTVSSVFFMCLSDRVLVYGDCAVNQDPNKEQLAQIAISSADTAKQFGIIPKVAMLSYSTGNSGSGEEVEKVRAATNIVKQLRPDILIEGPIQYDAAIDKSVAKTKLPNSKVAGEATVFIFPDLNTGNNTYKAVQRSSNALAIGPVLQGLKKPINDLSRGCLVEDIVNTVAITAIQGNS